MLVRTWLVPVVVLAAACGPEAAFVPRTGVYDVTVEIVDSDCSHDFDDRPTIDAIVVADGGLIVGFPDFPIFAEDVSGSWLNTWVYATLAGDPAGDGFVGMKPYFGVWDEVDGCQTRIGATVELLADDVVQTRVTYEWKGACEWLDEEQAACATIRESTATLREACEGCDLDTVQARAHAIYAEEHPSAE